MKTDVNGSHSQTIAKNTIVGRGVAPALNMSQNSDPHFSSCLFGDHFLNVITSNWVSIEIKSALRDKNYVKSATVSPLLKRGCNY